MESYKFITSDSSSGSHWCTHYVEFFRDGIVRVVADSEWKRWVFEGGKLTPKTAKAIVEDPGWRGMTHPDGWDYSGGLEATASNAKLLLRLQQEAFRRMAERRKEESRS